MNPNDLTSHADCPSDILKKDFPMDFPTISIPRDPYEALEKIQRLFGSISRVDLTVLEDQIVNILTSAGYEPKLDG
jgi:hypothetical protein